MKVAILTLRIHSNFGYLMQLYALQKIVKSLGHDPYTFYIKEEQHTLKAKAKELIYNLYVKYIRRENMVVFNKWITDDERKKLDKNTWDFVNNNIQLTDYIKSPKDFYNFDTSKYDAFIVGSDQVWRKPYSINLPLYYFSFLKSKQPRMSYAASFGKSDIEEYSSNLKRQCKQLVQKFNIVTVREKDGVDICREYFGIEAKQVLDPTLLLPVQEYMELAERGKKHNQGKPYIFTYLLDSNNYKWEVINEFVHEYGIEVINILPPKMRANTELSEEYVYPHVYDILSGFANAAYVFTDSFHASVFSIIFNRQFFVFPNEKRGNSRIYSLLSDYGIPERLITDGVTKNIIDYNSLNPSVFEKIEKSKEYLNSFLNE